MVWQRILRPAVPLPWLRLGQGRLRLAPVANQRNSPLLHCSASGGDGGGRTDKVLEEQRKRRAELTARISSDEFTAQGPGSVSQFPGQSLILLSTHFLLLLQLRR
ncbi:Cytochrome P450 97B2, chloroplastic [Hordeum vulgare]|nr:Cytochrome P450 97B2, chloroplastic [Hordeum vulgare]